MSGLDDPTLSAIFQPEGTTRALLVAGACGNVGFGKLGQFARLLGPKGIPVIALDLSDQVQTVKDKLREAYGDRFAADQVQAILETITVVQGTIDDVPADIELGFVFEALPERLELKRSFYEKVLGRDDGVFVFSATSGFPSTTLFSGLPGAERCGVMHPFFPHLTNKLWEVPTKGATTGKAEMKTVRKLLGRLGMNMIPVADVPAFAADRIFCGMMLEAVRIHADLGLSPAQVDDACKKLLGTSPFFVHNLIPGANYLSAHCMELMNEHVPSNLYEVPGAWRPYIDDPHKQWPYERGERCPPEQLDAVRTRMLGMLFALTADMIEHDVVGIDALNFLCENALAFAQGTPAIIEGMGLDEARGLLERFTSERGITGAETVAPAAALSPDKAGWGRVYVDWSVHDGVGLLSLKRRAINHTFIAELDAAYEALAADDAVRAIVIAPDGTYNREFGHGADLACFVPVLGKYDAALGLIQRWKRTLTKLRTGKPTVAALVGRVLGGGFELAAACRARIAAGGTKLAFPETTVGVIPGLGGCHHLHRLTDATSHARINEILLTGSTIDAKEAATLGIVSEVVPVKELPMRSMVFAAALASGDSPLPAFREGALEVEVDRDVATTNEAGVVLDAELRDLVARTIVDTNALPYADASRLEEQRAAESLCLSSSKIGVKAMMRGKPPLFEHPLQ